MIKHRENAEKRKKPLTDEEKEALRAKRREYSRRYWLKL
jgi:hypothetical protein